MRIADVMSRFIHTIESTASMGDASRVMAIFDVGVLPVVDGGELVGIVTDRDLIVRGMGEGLHPGTGVTRVMSAEVKTCREDDTLQAVLEIMGEEQIRRMPVCSRHGDLVGLVSLVDLARSDKYRDDVTAALRNICRPAGYHSQRLRVA
jgi:CBS domain-containing protein